MSVGSFFFSAAPTVQNSPELHFRFINSFIQPSLIGGDCKLEDNSWPVYFAINPDLFYFPLDPNPKLQKC